MFNLTPLYLHISTCFAPAVPPTLLNTSCLKFLWDAVSQAIIYTWSEVGVLNPILLSVFNGLFKCQTDFSVL